MEYIETRTFYCCFSAKCSIIFFGIVLLINTCFECYEVHLIFSNRYFGGIFGGIYVLFLIALVVALILVFIYWFAPDSRMSRGVLPWAFLTAAIANILIFVWIVIYIEAIYHGETIHYLPRFVYDEGDDPLENGKKKKLGEDTTYAR